MTDLHSLSTEALRRRAAYAGLRSLSGRSLKFATKPQLIEALERLLGVGAVDQSYLAQRRRSAAL